MARINTATQLAPKSEELLGMVEKKLGMRPNMMKTMAHSPAVLEGYLQFSGALSHGSLSAALREKLALVVGETNHCDYCLAAHTVLGGLAGVNGEEAKRSRLGTSTNAKEQAALQFAQLMVQSRGQVTDEDVQKLRESGFTEGELTEIVAHVALNIFTNYFNHVAATEVDFPRVS